MIGGSCESLWEDEAASLRFSEQSTGSLLGEPLDPGNPPGYYLLLKAWVRVFGQSEFALRLSSILVGVATVLMLFLLARLVTGSIPVALLSALLLSVTGGHVLMSQEVRSYALVTFFAVGSTWALFRCFDRSAPGRWLAYVALAFPMGWLHYQGYLVLFGQGVAGLLWFVVPRARRREFPAFALAQAAVIAAIFVVIRIHLWPSLTQGGVYDFWQPKADWRDPWLVLMRGTLGFGAAPASVWATLPLSLIAIALPAVLLFIGRTRDLRRYRTPLLAVLYAGPILFVTASFFAPIWQDKYLLAFQPFLMIAIACGLVRLFERCRVCGTALTVVLVATFLTAAITLKVRSPRPDYRAAARYLLEQSPDGQQAVLVLRFAWVAVEHYYPYQVLRADSPEELFASVHLFVDDVFAPALGTVHVVLSRMQSGPAEIERVRRELSARFSSVRTFEANRVLVLTLDD